MDEYGDEEDADASLMMMGLAGGSTSMASADRVEALRGEGSTPGSAARASLGMGVGADMLQQPGRGSSLGMEGGADGARASVGDDVGYGDFGGDAGAGGDDMMGGYGDGMDDVGGFGMQLDVGDGRASGAASALRKSATVEELIPGGLATADALTGRRAGVEDDEADGAASVVGAAGLGAAKAAAPRTDEEAAAARERAASKRRKRQAKRACRAMEDTVMHSDTLRQWIGDGAPTMRDPVGAAMAVRRLELACGRADDFTAPSGAFLVSRKPDDAVRAAMARSAVAGPSSTPHLMADDVIALLAAAGAGAMESRTSKLSAAEQGPARRFLARKLEAEAARRGGRSGAIVGGAALQAERIAAGGAAGGVGDDDGFAGYGGGAGGADYGAGDDFGGGGMDVDIGGLGGAEDDGYGYGYAGSVAGGAAASIGGQSELVADEDEGGDTESLLGGGEEASAASAARGDAAGPAPEAEDGDDAPEAVFRQEGRADAAAAEGDLSGMNRRTARMLGVLESELAKRAEAVQAEAGKARSAKDRREAAAAADDATLRLHDVIGGHSRRTAAVAFYEALVLKSADVIDMAQARPYGNIAIRRGPRFAEGVAQAAVGDDE